ncbi:MAG: DUF2029 domain-containing protein [Verrucomicrobia bacterium]|nr:DUF2029 domain-containing protein [Verrucomicrobiota bacterium]
MQSPGRKQAIWWSSAALIAWTAAFVVVVTRAIRLPNRALLLYIYEEGGQHWIHGQALYGNIPGRFVYGPLAAPFFAAILHLPGLLQAPVWIAINTFVFLAGAIALLRSGLYSIHVRYHGLALLLLLPLVLGNLDMTQANPLVIGFVMLATAAATRGKWSLAAICIGIAASFKVYPIVVGLLFVVLAPRRFTWRLLIALLVLGLLPFLYQTVGYVRDQYHLWFTTLVHDNRFSYQITTAPIDLWLLLVRLGHLPIAPATYEVIQVLSGASIALFCLAGRLRAWSERRLLVGVFSFACIWMTLLGPATEGLTYILLAPAVVLMTLDADRLLQPVWLRMLCLLSLLLLLLTVSKNSLAPHLFGVWTRGMQPVAALMFTAYCACTLLNGGDLVPAAALLPSECPSTV